MIAFLDAKAAALAEALLDCLHDDAAGIGTECDRCVKFSGRLDAYVNPCNNPALGLICVGPHRVWGGNL